MSDNGQIHDKQLVDSFLENRTRKNFLRIYNRYAPDLYRIAMHLCNYQNQHAEDVVQESWLTAVQKLQEFKFRSSLKTWLTGILYNKWRESNRYLKKHHSEDINQDGFENFQQSNLEDIYSVVDLKKAVKSLPDGYKKVLILHDIEGYKHREIAEILGVNEGTSKSQLYHARQSIKHKLEGYYEL